MSRESVYIPPKVRQPIVEPTYFGDFERHLGRTLPRAHQAVISALESMRFHGNAIRAVITEAPPPEGARAPHTSLHDLLLEYSRWIGSATNQTCHYRQACLYRGYDDRG